MSEMPSALSVQSLSKKFRVRTGRHRTIRDSLSRMLAGKFDKGKDLWALRDITFEMPKGETLGLIGHNGAGKSTLLRLLCGIGRPTTGKIQKFGSSGGLLELGSGFHPQLTGRENIRTVGILNGLTKRQVEAQEKEMISFAELEDFIDEPVRTYSTGMNLRLAFAAAIQMDPEILMIDEVLSVGDEGFRKKCLARLQEFQRAGKTLILASHELEQIQVMCDEVLVLEDGVMVYRSEPAEAVKEYHNLLRLRTERRAAKLSSTPNVVVEQPQEGKRMGTQEASITEVRFLDATGNVIQTLESGTALTIELCINLIKDLSDFAITLGVFTETDVKCFESVIPSARKLLSSYNGNGKFRCEVLSLPLLAGRYFVNVGIFPVDFDVMYDYHWQMHPLEVVSQAQNLSGILSVNPHWSGES